MSGKLILQTKPSTMKQVFILLALFSFAVLQSQETSEFKLLGKEYQYQFSQAKNAFTICKISDGFKDCKSKELKNDDAFKLPEMQTMRDEYFKDIREKFSSYEELDIKINVNELSSTSKDTLFISAPVELAAFILERTEVNSVVTYKLKPINKLLIVAGEFELNYSDDIIAKESDFKSKIIELTKSSLSAKKDDILKAVSKIYTDPFDNLYRDKIEKSKKYSYLTTEELELPDGSKKKFIWHKLISNDLFHLRVTPEDDVDSNTKYGPFEIGIGQTDFVLQIYEGQQFKENAINKVTLEKIYLKIEKPIQEVREKKQNKIQKERIASIADSIENIATTYSGRMILNKDFPLYPKKLSKKQKGKYLTQSELPRTFHVDSATVSFFNNRADNVVVTGKVDGKSYVLINKLYSLPLREFNHPEQRNWIHDEKKFGSYEYYYDDVFDYGIDTKYNYAVKSEEIKLKPGDSVKLKERKLLDYFTGIFFSDFLGLNNNNKNGLIIAEAQMRFPVHLRNYGWFTVLDNITIYASANLFSGFETNSRKILLDDFSSATPESFKEDDPYQFRTDNFNLLLNNNIDAGIRASIATFEWKAASSFIHFRYGLRFLRTGVQYNLNEIGTNEDGTTTNSLFAQRDFQVFSVGQEFETTIEIRPQSNIGADITTGLNWFGATGTSKNDIKFNTVNNSPNLKVMANLYALTNPNSKKSGLFFRLGAHYDLGNFDLYPQIMVGYATNLTSFVNRVQSK